MDKRILFFIFAALLLSSAVFVFQRFYNIGENVSMYYIINPSESASVGDSITFNDLTEGVDRWKWDFGDGEYSDRKNGSHTYVNAGIYNIKLTVYGTFGHKTDAKKTIEIKAAEIRPQVVEEIIILGPDKVTVGQSVNFESKYKADGYNWQVENDDRYEGRVQKNKTATYSFHNPGTRYIVLTTDNPVNTYRKKIEVEEGAETTAPAPKPVVPKVKKEKSERKARRKASDDDEIIIPKAREL